MALFDSWSDRNKKITNGLAITYTCTPKYWASSDATVRFPIYWKLVRQSSMQFQYFGMTEAVANACASAMRREFTRKYMRWTPTVIERDGEAPVVLINNDSVVECSSSIQPNPTAGDNWHVDCQIAGTDEIIVDHEVTDVDEFESLFQSASQRDDPPAGGSIAIESAKWESGPGAIYVDFNPIILNFNPQNLIVQIKGEGDVWTDASIYGQAQERKVAFRSDDNATFRLKYGDIVSAPWTTKDRPTPNIVIKEATYTQEYNINHISTGYTVRVTDTAGHNIFNKSAYKLGFYNAESQRIRKLDFNGYQVDGDDVILHLFPYIGIFTDGHSHPKPIRIVLEGFGELISDPITPKAESPIDMQTPEYIGIDEARSTYVSPVFKFRINFTTDLPRNDVLSSLDVESLNGNYRFELAYTSCEVIDESVVVSETGQGSYSVEFSAGGFVLRWYDKIRHPFFFLTVNSKGSLYRSYISYVDFGIQNGIQIYSFTQTGTASADISFLHDLDSFDISRLKLFVRNGKDHPTSEDDDLFREVQYTYDPNSPGKLTIGYTTGGWDGLYRLEYSPASGDVVRSAVFGRNAIYINLVKVELHPSTGNLIATWKTEGRQLTNNRVQMYNGDRALLQYVDRNSDTSNIYSGNGSWFFLYDEVSRTFSTPKGLVV